MPASGGGSGLVGSGLVGWGLVGSVPVGSGAVGVGMVDVVSSLVPDGDVVGAPSEGSPVHAASIKHAAKAAAPTVRRRMVAPRGRSPPALLPR
ncbi:hypothetical protein GCM10011331_11770 [Flavimobilis marinus]|nr:hypothetical protein GCM10011331_11770 [Flavimobilis marinus]